MKKIVLYIVLSTFFATNAYADLGHEIIRISACGLKIIEKSTRVTARRPEYPYQPLHPKPIKFQVSEFPANCFEVERAYIWWIISDADVQLTNPSAVFINPAGTRYNVPALELGRGIAKGYGEQYTRSFRADVTNYITGNGTYSIDVNSSNDETDGITLFIAYKHLTANPMFEGHLVINDGLTTKIGENMNEILDGFTVCETPTMAQAYMLTSDLQWMYKLYGGDTLKTVDVIVNGEIKTIGRDFYNSNFFNVSLIKGQNSSQFGILEVNPIEKDAYSWAVMGLYYKTPPCRECPEKLPVNITNTNLKICPGESITLEPSGADTYEWTSKPPGFTSKQRNPVVAPLVSTDYIVKGVLGANCLTGYDTIHVEVFPRIIGGAGPDRDICLGQSDTLGIPTSGGSPPYRYQWTPATWLSAVNIARPVITPAGPITYYLEISDRNNCSVYDTINIDILLLDKPNVNVVGETLICPCDSVRLEAESGFVSYLWTNGDTNRVTYAKTEGDYVVVATAANGCKGISDPVHISVHAINSEVGFPPVNAEPGDTVDLQLTLISGDKLDLCGLENFSCEISFNKTLMYPLDNYAQGDNFTDSEFRTLRFTGSREQGSNVLKSLNMLAAWGNIETDEITINEFEWTDCAVEEVAKTSGSITIDSLCKEGGQTRLFFIVPKPVLKISPNPAFSEAALEYEIPADGYSELFIVDMLGRKVKTLYAGMANKGNYTMQANISELTSGLYFIALNTTAGTISKTLEVGK